MFTNSEKMSGINSMIKIKLVIRYIKELEIHIA